MKIFGSDILLREKCNILDECKIINFPKVTDYRGRVYYLYDVPSGASRGGHAHKELQQIIIALSGSFDVILDDGCNRRSFFLNRPHYGLYISPRIWRELENFSSNSVALSLVSQVYDESDYIRDYDAFKKTVENDWK
jgi:glyoxylate utilization-related uncharacterized protein